MFRKNVIIFITVLVLAIGAYYLLLRKTQEPKEPQIPTFMKETTEDMWQPLKPNDGSFQVLLPAMPQHSQGAQPLGQTGEQIKYEVYTAQGADGTKYMMSIAKYPETFNTSTPQSVLNTLLQELANAEPKNEIIGQQPSTFKSFPSLDFDLQNIKHATLGRAVLANHSLYVLLAINQDRNNLEKNFHTFADSLTIG